MGAKSGQQARIHALKQKLTASGVTPAGAEQFTQAQPVTDPADRELLLEIMTVAVMGRERPAGFQSKTH